MIVTVYPPTQDQLVEYARSAEKRPCGCDTKVFSLEPVGEMEEAPAGFRDKKQLPPVPQIASEPGWYKYSQKVKCLGCQVIHSYLVLHKKQETPE